jgi:hypothetical protein
MRKLLTIMLALLVIGGVAFAEDPAHGYSETTLLDSTTPVAAPADVTLTLQANAPGFFKHGFSNTDATTFGQIVSITLGSAVFKLIDLDSSEVQGLGFYQIATNTRNDFTVTLSATGLKSEEYVPMGEGGTGVFIYIPYTLKVGTTNVPVGSGAAILTAAPANGSYTFFDDGDGDQEYLYGQGGILAGSYPLSITLPDFYSEDIAETGGSVAVPEGNYSATITVAVNAI